MGEFGDKLVADGMRFDRCSRCLRPFYTRRLSTLCGPCDPDIEQIPLDGWVATDKDKAEAEADEQERMCAWILHKRRIQAAERQLPTESQS